MTYYAAPNTTDVAVIGRPFAAANHCHHGVSDSSSAFRGLQALQNLCGFARRASRPDRSESDALDKAYQLFSSRQHPCSLERSTFAIGAAIMLRRARLSLLIQKIRWAATG